MIWENWNDFFEMGGYAPYVWGSYLVTLGLMAVEGSLLIMRRRNILKYLGHNPEARREGSMNACQGAPAVDPARAFSAPQQQDFTQRISTPTCRAIAHRKSRPFDIDQDEIRP